MFNVFVMCLKLTILGKSNESTDFKMSETLRNRALKGKYTALRFKSCILLMHDAT